MTGLVTLGQQPGTVAQLPIAHGVDFAIAVALRRMAILISAPLAYLFASKMKALLFYIPDLLHYMLLEHGCSDR